MKKILLSMLGAVVALTSCQKDELSSLGDRREVAVSIAASLPTTMTRSSEKGGIDNVDWTTHSLRYTLEIYDGETRLPVSKEDGAAMQRVLYKESAAEAKATAFNDIRLLSGRQYQFVIWADFVKKDHSELYYTTQATGGLKAITRASSSFKECNDAADAYFATETITLTESTTKAITLKRPFGKLRIITTDIKDIVNATVTEQTPVTVMIDGGIEANFNAYDGTIPGGGGNGFTSTYTTTIKELTAEQGTLFFEYFLLPTSPAASPVQKPFHFEVQCLGATFKMETDAVKLERNKLTTVKGKLLTKGVDVSVTIEDEFDTPSIDFTAPVEAPTPAAAQAKLDGIDFGATDRPAAPISISVTEVVANNNGESAILAIPAAVTTTNTPQIQVNLAAGIADGQTFTLKQTVVEGGNAPAYDGKVYVAAPASTAGALVIDMPSATVYVNGKIQQLTATVSPNTLIIEKEAQVTNLTLNKGNTIIYGNVTNIKFDKALFETPFSLDEDWNGEVLPAMTIIAVYDRLLNISDPLIEGIAADSIPEVVRFAHFNLPFDVMFNQEWMDSPYGMHSHWFDTPILDNLSAKNAHITRRAVRSASVTTDIVINRLTTFPGNFSFTGNGRLVLNAHLTLNGSTIDAANNIGIAPITIRSSNVVFTGKNITLNQATSGKGDGTSKSGLGIVVEESSSINKVKINLTDSHLNMNGPTGYQRAIVFPTAVSQTGMEVNLLRTDITCLTTTTMQNATYSQGVGIGALVNPKITLTDCDLTGMYYAINNAGASPTNMELTIDNSRLSGYSALNLRGSSSIEIKNGSVLTGRNFYSAGSNAFAAIIYDAGAINAPSTLVVDNSTIQNLVASASKEYMIDVRGNSNVAIALQNNTKLLDKSDAQGSKLDYMIEGLGEGSAVTNDGTTILVGKTGVTLIAL